VVNDEDVTEGFKLYEEISAANELGLPPEVYNIYTKLKDQIPDEGSTRKELQTTHYQIFHRAVGKKRLDQVLSLLETVGLLTEEPDPNDRRQKRFLLTPRGVYISSMENQHLNNVEKINTPEGVSNAQEKRGASPGVCNSESFYSTCWICRETIRLNEAFKPHNGKPAHLRCIEKIDSAQRE